MHKLTNRDSKMIRKNDKVLYTTYNTTHTVLDVIKNKYGTPCVVIEEVIFGRRVETVLELHEVTKV